MTFSRKRFCVLNIKALCHYVLIYVNINPLTVHVYEVTDNCNIFQGQGRIQKVQKGRARTPFFWKGGRKMPFERSFQCFSYKSL